MRALWMLFISFVYFTLPKNSFAQTTDFDVAEYQQFLDQNQDMETSQLLDMHPAGNFKDDLNLSWESALYHDSIEIVLNLTDYEKSLLQKHGFVVTERLRKDTFYEQFSDIWQKDLPVFISTDAILHAFHFNYVKILKMIERGIIINRLTTLLAEMHNNLPDLISQYSANPEMEQMLRDVDVYITVPRKLLGLDASAHYAENAAVVSEILNLINAEKFDVYPFFSMNCKDIDFSQFKPRGHYAENEDLSQYFRAMMWLGRIEIYLLAPKAEPLSCPKQTKADIQRQTIDAILISELMDLADANSIYEEIEGILSFVVGEQDNVTPGNLKSLIESISLTNASALLDTIVLNEFQDSLKTKPYAGQRILSQVLAHDPFSPGSVEPASAFLLFGQRFIIDSYVTGKVVFDQIKYNNRFPCRLFPSTQDVLFALGNDASAQLLVPELDEYHHSSNLSALRYLIDSYDSDFWNSSIHTMWLNTIQTLNPPLERGDLPKFMQTGAWWQQKMNTQLSSWTELRHDHLLYAKQSYTSGWLCSYPCGYVEPFPKLYQNLSKLAVAVHDQFINLPFSDDGMKTEIIDYYSLFKSVSDTLGTIAQKELDGAPLDSMEISFMRQVLYHGHYGIVDGWYMKLLLGPDKIPDTIDSEPLIDYIVADYHTTPTGCAGNIMGWVSHAGTGPVDLAIVTAPMPDGHTTAFVGPVMSYYDYRTTNFLRLTDTEWEETYLASASRPDWVNVYLANGDGESRGEGATLTAINDNQKEKTQISSTHIVAQNYPNPFNASTIISFSIPSHMPRSNVELTVYNINGQVIKTLLKRELTSGNYLTRWNGTDDFSNSVSSGIYFYKIRVAGNQVTGKMILTK